MAEKTLNQIVESARIGEPLTNNELRFAVCAFDVLLAQLDISQNPEQLASYFVAAELPPEAYLGENNHPDSAAFREWYTAFKNFGAKKNETIN